MKSQLKFPSLMHMNCKLAAWHWLDEHLILHQSKHQIYLGLQQVDKRWVVPFRSYAICDWVQTWAHVNGLILLLPGLKTWFHFEVMLFLTGSKLGLILMGLTFITGLKDSSSIRDWLTLSTWWWKLPANFVGQIMSSPRTH